MIISKTLNTSKSISIALDELINGLGIKRKLQEYDAVVYWDIIVGAQIAKVTTATQIKKGVLRIKVKTSTWRNELTIRKKEIIERLNNYLGTEIVNDIKFQ